MLLRSPIFKLSVLVICLTYLVVFLRISKFTDHFSSIDDLLVPTIIKLHNTDGLKDPNKLPSSLEKIDKKFWGKLKEVFLVKVLDLEQIDSLRVSVRWFERKIVNLLVISLDTTYAPLQYLISSLALNQNSPYQETLFYSRIPSVIFSILSLLVLLKYYDFKRNFFFLIPLVTILGLSWENIIYSSQSQPYMAGLFFSILMFFQFKDIYSKDCFKRPIWVGILFGISTYFQYQLIIICFVFYLSVTYQFLERKNWNQIRSTLFSGVAYLVVVIPVLLIIFKYHSQRSVNWNAGPHLEYLFTTNGKSLTSLISYILVFFTQNILSVAADINNFVPSDSKISILVSWFYKILFVLGAFRIALKKNKEKVFFFFLFLVWFLLVVVGKLTLSPSRHSLIFQFFLVYLITNGISFSLSLILRARREIYRWVVISFLTLAVFLFQNFSSDEFEKRKDFYLKDKMMSYVLEEKPDLLILVNWAWQPLHLTELRNLFPIIYFEVDNPKLFSTEELGKESVEKIMIISQKENPDSKQVIQYLDSIKTNYSKELKIEFTGRKTLLMSELKEEKDKWLEYNSVFKNTLNNNYLTTYILK